MVHSRVKENFLQDFLLVYLIGRIFTTNLVDHIFTIFWEDILMYFDEAI